MIRTSALLVAAVLLVPRVTGAQDITESVPATRALAGEARRLDSLGLEAWRRYEGLAHRGQLSRTDDASGLEMPKPPDPILRTEAMRGALPLFDLKQIRMV